ncbi:MAG: hypothetical protein NVS4B13_00250 [Candidatus Elarobacter sp.]
MPATRIGRPVSGERLLGIEPQLLQQVNPGWRHRLNLFNGRTLSDTALDGEQLYRSGLLATLGQAVTPGTVKGLVFSLDARPADPTLTVTPGYGIAATGEDVSLPRALQTKLSTLIVLDPVTGDVQQLFATYRQGAGNAHAGVIVLQSIVAQVSGATFNTGTAPFEVSGTVNASCDPDPAEYAFEDRQIADGVRLGFVPWPNGVASLELPAQDPAATWRNRLAYAIFDAEAHLGPDRQFPWMMLGVPLALVAFDATWKPLFIDRSSVVRPGGLPRRHFVLPSAAPEAQSGAGLGTWRPNTAFTAGRSIVDSKGNVQTALVAGQSGASQPAWNDVFLQTIDNGVTWVNNGTPVLPIVQPPLAQARVGQLAEQIEDRLGQASPIFNLADMCALLPPSGILPAAALDLATKRSAWLPRNWSLSAAPVHIEELEAVLRTGMLAEPIRAEARAPDDPAHAEPVEVLVPLPDELYDPRILVTETVAPDFQHEIDKATQSRNGTLRARKAVQLQINTLNAAVGPSNAIDLNAGLTLAEQGGRDTLPPFLPQQAADPNLDQTFGIVGPATWQPNTAYVLGQFVYDSNGNIQRVQNDGGGTSGATQPAWNVSPGATTSDGSAHPITWFNVGPGTWQANTDYRLNQFIFDANGNLQVIQTGGSSGPSQYKWNAQRGARTIDGGVTWVNGGPAAWQGGHAYTAGTVTVDANGNRQVVQSPGTSDASQPLWATDFGEGTPDGPQLVWINEGAATLWEPNTPYALHECTVDPAGNVQEVAVAGTSGDSQLIWNPNAGQVTTEVAQRAGAVWINHGTGAWQGTTVYAAGQFVFAPNGTIQTATVAGGKPTGTSGTTQPAWAASTGQQTADGTIVWIAQGWGSADVQRLHARAAGAPYTISYTDASGAHTIPLIGADDWTDLQNQGLAHFIDRLNAKVKRANDLLDLAFLTSQTDIYRFRQNILNTVDASRLATSPVLANIATGETASATAEQLRKYFSTTGSKPVAHKAAMPQAFAAAPAAETTTRMSASERGLNLSAMRTVTPLTPSITRTVTEGDLPTSPSLLFSRRPIVGHIGHGAESIIAEPIGPALGITQPTTQDIVEQSPIVGAQLDVRTLTIAERLTQSPSQEAMFYAVSNRAAFMQALLNLEITVDDLPFLVDGTPSKASEPVPTVKHFVSELRDLQMQSSIYSKVQTPHVPADVDEGGLFSSGVRALEQHTQLMRALEARVQLYADFAALCNGARANIHSNVQKAHNLLVRLENDLAQTRQDVAFTSALLADERRRVQNVNEKRAQVLRTSVHVVVYTRPRTLKSTQNVPSRQLVPGNIASPVPACLEQPGAVPPELREIVALLRDAPLNWMPSIQSLLDSLGHPTLLFELATDVRARATLALQSPLKPSSALSKPNIYAPAISTMYVSHQRVFRDVQAQRAAFQPTALTNRSWSAQIAMLGGVLAVGDLISSSAVHAEIANATSQLIGQISSVAACVYARANLALPADRLAWAEFLRGPGAGVQLRSLAVLPHWNTQPYLDRQQMQLLVDWLFQKIDRANSAALAYMSDVVRTSILLASHAPVNAVIAGAVVARKQPTVGHVIALSLPSQTVSSGMHVQLFSKGVLTAEAVVSDLDSTSVSATVTRVHQPGVFLETHDVAHFTTHSPRAAALHAFAQ